MFAMKPMFVRMPEGAAPAAPRRDAGTWAAARDASAELLGSHGGAPKVAPNDEAAANAESLAALLVAYSCVPPGPEQPGAPPKATRPA